MTRNEADTLRSRVEDRERRTRELEEQIQNDDRVEILESKLKNTQDRAEEVSFQLSKLKQVDKLHNIIFFDLCLQAQSLLISFRVIIMRRKFNCSLGAR